MTKEVFFWLWIAFLTPLVIYGLIAIGRDVIRGPQERRT